MFKKRVFKVYTCIRILMICIILHREAKTSVAGSNSCEVTRSTVQIVGDCPVSEDEWREAAERKRCDVPAKQCSESKRLVYHCVINPYVNQTLEVCAYAQNIVLGQCTSYSKSGNEIQGESRADCSKFEENACPQFYRSDVAYKYPGCYNLTKKLTTVANNPMSTRNSDTTVVFTTTTLSSNGTLNIHVEMPRKEEKMDTNVATIAIITSVLVLLIIVSIVVVWKKYGKNTRQRQSIDELPKKRKILLI